MKEVRQDPTLFKGNWSFGIHYHLYIKEDSVVNFLFFSFLRAEVEIVYFGAISTN